MEKAYNHLSSEADIYAAWEASGAMRADETSDKPPFTIPLPPPNVTGELHLGHAAMLAIQDIMTRYKKMQGHEVLWLPGTDHAAIATENVVIKHHGKTSREQWPSREDFMVDAKAFADQKHDNIVNQMKRMGSWLDWSREAYTFDEPRNHAVNAIFKDLYKDGLIERGYRLINWSTGAQSVLSDDELEYDDVKEPFYYIKCGKFIMGTVRPETKCANSPLIVHPDEDYVEFESSAGDNFIVIKRLFDDKEKFFNTLNFLDAKADYKVVATTKGSDLVGQKFTAETYAGEREFFVIADTVIDPEKGSGAMTISASHSADDYDLAKRLGLDDMFIEKINLEGNMTDIAGPVAGMFVKKARNVSGKLLEEKGLLVGKDVNYSHRVPLCYRSNCVVEPMISPQWFIMVNKPFETRKLQNFVCVRHGESEGNVARTAGGDPNLTDKGRDQAKKTAANLRGRKITKILCSDLSRAKETAEIIKKELSLNIEIEVWKNLREINYGNFEEVPFPKKGVEAFILENEGGERPKDLLDRANEVYEKFAGMDEEGEVLVVSHNTFLSGLFGCRAGVTPENFIAHRNNWHMENAEPKFLPIVLEKTETTTLKAQMQAAVREDHVQIIPERFNKEYFRWIDNLQDWCISRQIWWGHRIPVWYDAQNNIHLAEEQEIIFARHGESEGNRDGKVQGIDDPLTEKGRQHATDMIPTLKKEKIGVVVSGTSARNAETADIIAEGLGVEVIHIPELSAFDFGKISGLKYEEIDRITPIKYCRDNNEGENFEAFVERLKIGLEKLKQVKADGRIVFVTNRSIYSVLQVLREGGETSEIFEKRSKNSHLPHGLIDRWPIFQAPEGDNLRQDEDTLDTWFSSALWPFSTLGWPNNDAPDLQKFYNNAVNGQGTDVLETGWDILFFWVARMIMFGRYATGKFPFHTVYLHGMVTDEHGKKMSKSKGNGIDPIEMIEEFGADPVRLALVIGSTPGQKIPIGKNKIKGYRNFVNKLWNAGRFVKMQFDEYELQKLDGAKACPSAIAGAFNDSLADNWILGRLAKFHQR